MRAFFRIKSRATAENNFTIIEILRYSTKYRTASLWFRTIETKMRRENTPVILYKSVYRNIPETASSNNNSEIKNLLRKIAFKQSRFGGFFLKLAF